MSTTRRVGNINEQGGKNGTLYDATYFVLNADKDTYTPTYQLAGDTAPFEFPANTYIYDWSVDSKTDHWIIIIKACDNDYNWGDSSGGNIDNPDKVLKSYGITRMFFPYNWFGMCKWKDHRDYQTWVLALKRQADGKTIDNKVIDDITKWSVELASDSSMYATSGEHIVFMNASARESKDGGDAGSLDYTESEDIFVDTSGLLTTWAGHNVQTVSYTCTMYRNTTNSLESYISWAGINGGFTPPSGCTPTGYTLDGTWKSVKQTIKENYKQFNNTWYDEIVRVMIKAPAGLRFKVGAFNGDTWDW